MKQKYSIIGLFLIALTACGAKTIENKHKQQRVVAEKIEDSSVSTSTTIYTLSNGNVVKKEETRKHGKTVTTFKHDNAKTVWSLRPFIVQPEYFDEKDVNKNNITSKEVIDTYSHNGQTNTYKSTYRYEYEYTPEGYPKTIKEYNSEGKLEEIKEYEY